MKTEPIEIVDRGRGPQLSTCRITVLDLVPYFQRAALVGEIRRWIPTLSEEEIAIVHRYYLEHKTEFDEKEQQANERRAEQIRLQRLRFPELTETAEETKARLRRLRKTSAGDDSPDSLNAAIRLFNAPKSLPVFTISDLGRFGSSSAYEERVVAALYDYLFRIDDVRGTGRLFLP